mmetsp:Transcript_20029/g.59498  ORF Transcript_20029/g.59498 Transcript_20029/m.59498 type:complete len:108 (-) Transcript_20029:271-594(-)
MAPSASACFAFSIMQGINGAIRPHKSKRFRTQWEWLHKGSGWIAIVLGIVNVSLGCFLVVGPDAVWIAWFCWLGVLTAVAAIFECLWWKQGGYPPVKAHMTSTTARA